MNQPPSGLDNGQKQPIFLMPLVVTVLVGLLWAVHLGATLVLDPESLANFRIWFGFVPLRLVAPELLPGGFDPIWWSGFTHAFLHVDFPHLIVNSAWLVVFGTPVARRYGAGPTLVVFLFGAMAGALALTAHQLSDVNQFMVLIGASGGVSALTGAALRFIFQPVLFGTHPESGDTIVLGRRTARLFEMVRDVRARTFVIVWLGLNLAIPLAPLVTGVDLPIAWEAHIGGFILGLLLPTVFDTRARQR